MESEDDPYVAALRAAGAIPIAKTNVPQLLIYTESDNPLYGRTNNPWNMERSCGGSSGGEAALIAAGASPLGLGNDIGGSLRIPAAFCGIASIRPTAGRTPDRCGHGLPIGQQAIVSQVGPMAKRVEDLVMALRIIERGRDPLLEPGPELGDPASVELARLRFATFTDDGEFPVAPAARRAVAEAAQMLIAAGAKRVEWRKPALSQVNDLFFACLSADRGSAFKRMLRGNRVDGRIRSLLLTGADAALAARHSARRARRHGPASRGDAGSPALVRQRRRLLADGRGDGPLPARLSAIARYRRRRPDRSHSLPRLCGAGAAARCEPDDAAAGRLRPARPGHRSSRRHRAGHARSSRGRERPPGEPRSGRARRPRERARERRPADRRAGDRPALARSRRARGGWPRSRQSREARDDPARPPLRTMLAFEESAPATPPNGAPSVLRHEIDPPGSQLVDAADDAELLSLTKVSRMGAAVLKLLDIAYHVASGGVRQEVAGRVARLGDRRGERRHERSAGGRGTRRPR